jgi:inner membrane protein
VFLFEHCGITLAVAFGINAAVTKIHSRPSKSAKTGNPPVNMGASSQPEQQPSSIISLFGSLGKHLDIRFLLIGSIFPDIIDKPVGLFFYGNGRTFAHTLIFALTITLIGIYINKTYKKNWVLALAAGSFSHLILDEMWLSMHTLLWPLYGWTFRGRIEPAWFGLWWKELFGSPMYYLGEFACLAIILFFIGILIKQRKFIFFLKNGYF